MTQAISEIREKDRDDARYRALEGKTKHASVSLILTLRKSADALAQGVDPRAVWGATQAWAGTETGEPSPLAVASLCDALFIVRAKNKEDRWSGQVRRSERGEAARTQIN